MKRALVLGGAGFIGSNVVRGLVGGGTPTRVLTRASRSIANLGSVVDAIEVVRGDFMDDRIVRESLRDVDTVFHLITTTFPNLVASSSNFDLLSNLLPTVRLLELALDAGVRRIVYASSGGTIYGEPRTLPIPESHPLAPKSAYGQSKLTIENYLSFYGRTTSLEVSILRLANPYGPAQNPYGIQGVVAVAMGAIANGRALGVYGDGSAVRDYVYIDDVVSAMLAAAVRPPIVANISSGEGHSVAEILAAVERTCGRPLERRALPERIGDVVTNVLDNGLARRMLQWEPTVGLDEGLARTWAAMQHGSRE